MPDQREPMLERMSLLEKKMTREDVRMWLAGTRGFVGSRLTVDAEDETEHKD